MLACSGFAVAVGTGICCMTPVIIIIVDGSCIINHRMGAQLSILLPAKGHHECVSILLAHGAEVNKAIKVSEGEAIGGSYSTVVLE